MCAHDGANVRILSGEQAHALAAVAGTCDVAQNAEQSISVLTGRTSAILGAAFLVLVRRAGAWSAVTGSQPPHPLTAGIARALSAVPALDAIAVRRMGGEDWTLVQGHDQEPKLAFAIEGDWTLSADSFLALARLLQTGLERVDARAAAARRGRLHHRMMYRLGRVDGLARIGATVLRYAALAVEARVGAIVVTSAGTLRASIVATFGYPLAMVEHVQIEPGVGVIGTVLQSRKPMLETGADTSTRAHRPRYRTRSFVAVPILAGLETLGAIAVTDRQGDRPFSATDVTALRVFATGAALAIGRERALNLADLYARAAAVDPVTGLFNRRYFEGRLDEELQRSQRHQIPVALLLIDVDDFKLVNDSFGHLAGDTALRDIGEILRNCVRIFDVCARFGGEEFVIIMPGSNRDSAFRVAERIRQRVDAYRPLEREVGALRITVSIGLAVSSPGTTVSELLELSDKALYAAKRAGKNRIRSAPTPGDGRTVEDANAGSETEDGETGDNGEGKR